MTAASPVLHDWELDGIQFGGGTDGRDAELRCRSPDGQRATILLQGVHALAMHGFRQGNIVLHARAGR